MRLLTQLEFIMKRFHVHTTVVDLPKSIAFYSKLFDAEPTRVEADYAKWMLDDPRVGHHAGHGLLERRLVLRHEQHAHRVGHGPVD